MSLNIIKILKFKIIVREIIVREEDLERSEKLSEIKKNYIQ